MAETTVGVKPSSASGKIDVVVNQVGDKYYPVYDFHTDSANFDAFARLRVSHPETIFDSKQIHDKQPLLWDDAETSGGSTGSTWSQASASTKLDVAASTAGTRIRQTFRRFNYQPGKSQLILATGTLDSSGGGTGIKQCFGLYDDNNGIFLINDEGTKKVVTRSKVSGSVVDTAVAQTSWNLDPMDGTGPSGVTLDFTKSQILIIDMEWLGVGRVRVGFVIDGIPMYVHQFLNANVLEGVYMSTPNLPLRYEIQNDGNGGAAEIEHICSSVMSEGGTQDIGVNRANSLGTAFISANTAGTVYAVVGLRLKAANLDGDVKIINLSIMDIQSVDYEWQVIVNPTVANTPTWANETNSIVQFGKGDTVNSPSNTTVTGGTVISAGYEKGGRESGATTFPFDTTQRIGSQIDGTPDEIWLCVKPLQINADIVGGLAWREIS